MDASRPRGQAPPIADTDVHNQRHDASALFDTTVYQTTRDASRTARARRGEARGWQRRRDVTALAQAANTTAESRAAVGSAAACAGRTCRRWTSKRWARQHWDGDAASSNLLSVPV